MEKLKDISVGVGSLSLLTRTELQGLLKLSGKTITRLVTAGGLPRPIKVGQRERWRASDITSFIEGQACPNSGLPESSEEPTTSDFARSERNRP